MKNLFYLLIITFFVSCQSDTQNHGVQLLIVNKTKSSEAILKDIDDFVNKHGRKGFERQYDLAMDLANTHKDVLSFLDSLDGMEASTRHTAAAVFMDKTFNRFKITYPYLRTIDERTPLELIKLQVVELEHLCLREWGQNVNHIFNQMTVAIMIDTITYRSDGKITGRVGFMGYSEALPLTVKVNGKDATVIQSLGHFSLDPRDLPTSSKTITAEVIFPGATYTSTIVVDK